MIAEEKSWLGIQKSWEAEHVIFFLKEIGGNSVNLVGPGPVRS